MLQNWSDFMQQLFFEIHSMLSVMKHEGGHIFPIMRSLMGSMEVNLGDLMILKLFL
jgi:hypothetical protein